MGYYSPFWGPEAISTIDDPRVAFTCRLSALIVFTNSDPFRELLLAVFGVPERFSWMMDPHSALLFGSSTLAILADSGRFMGYYSPFWGPGAIFTFDEPQGAFTCWASTLAILLDSGPLHGLLITISGSDEGVTP